MFIGNANIIGSRPIGSAPSFTNTKSLLFDGVDEYVNLPGGTPSGISSTQNFTVSYWFKGWGGGRAHFGFWSSSTQRILARTQGDYIAVHLAIGTNTTFNTNSIANYNDGLFHHCVIVYDGTQATNDDRCVVYIDGVDVTPTGKGTIGTTTASSYAGNQIANNAYYSPMSGGIDEFSIFNYSLTSGQVTSIYNSGTPTDLDNTSGVTAPVHWWRMGDGDTYPTINDVGTTGGNNGTMTNMESGDIATDTP